MYCCVNSISCAKLLKNRTFYFNFFNYFNNLLIVVKPTVIVVKSTGDQSLDTKYPAEIVNQVKSNHTISTLLHQLAVGYLHNPAGITGAFMAVGDHDDSRAAGIQALEKLHNLTGSFSI